MPRRRNSLMPKRGSAEYHLMKAGMKSAGCITPIVAGSLFLLLIVWALV